MKRGNFSVRKRLESFRFAFNGLKIMVREEHNSRIHMAAALLALILGWYLEINSGEWLVLIGVTGLVFTAELLNSALEHLADVVSAGYNGKVKKAKDLAAASVLVSSIIALLAGCIIFLPKIAELLW